MPVGWVPQEGSSGQPTCQAGATPLEAPEDAMIILRERKVSIRLTGMVQLDMLTLSHHDLVQQRTANPI